MALWADLTYHMGGLEDKSQPIAGTNFWHEIQQKLKKRKIAEQ